MTLQPAFRVMVGAAFCTMVIVAVPGVSTADDEFKSARDAYSAGARHLNAKEYGPAQQALETALKLAEDDEFRIRVYEALLVAYRQLPEIDKMLEAGEFIIRHANQPAKRSLTTRALVSFVFQRGKVDEATKRYEKCFEDNPNDMAAVSMLAMIYARVERDKERGALFTEKLAVLNIAAARKHAEQCEKDAASASQLAPSLWKDAAVAWLEAQEKAKALAAAKKSIEVGPEPRGELLAYFWHEALGSVFLKAGEPKLAIEQLEAALAITKIEGYRKSCEAKLSEARAALEKQ